MDNNIQNILEHFKYQEYLDSNIYKWEHLRESFRPTEIKNLIVGEAPPNGSSRFFYYDNVQSHDNLFISVMSVLYPTETSIYKNKRTPDLKNKILNNFKNDGFYLMDLYPMPLDEKPKGKGENFFKEVFLRKLQNEPLSKSCKIFLLNPAKILELPLKLMGYEVYVLPFPLYQGKNEFIKQFNNIINKK